jgi:hypothetical protein
MRSTRRHHFGGSRASSLAPLRPCAQTNRVGAPRIRRRLGTRTNWPSACSRPPRRHRERSRIQDARERCREQCASTGEIADIDRQLRSDANRPRRGSLASKPKPRVALRRLALPDPRCLRDVRRRSPSRLRAWGDLANATDNGGIGRRAMGSIATGSDRKVASVSSGMSPLRRAARVPRSHRGVSMRRAKASFCSTTKSVSLSWPWRRISASPMSCTTLGWIPVEKVLRSQRVV